MVKSWELDHPSSRSTNSEFDELLEELKTYSYEERRSQERVSPMSKVIKAS